ncbi:MAG: hypothetical protein CMJ54_11905 [Planctomycetaceae bacterium]|nr:hypothetical protein [Planctomycetaceae bacterium]
MPRHSTAKLLLAMVAACTLADLPAPATSTPASIASTATSATGTIRIVGAERTRPDGAFWARSDADVHGRLSLLRVELLCEDADPRRARRAFADALGLNFVDHFPKPDADAQAPATISIALRDVSAVEALEALIEASSGSRRAAWQVRSGILEVGPRETLARRTRPISRVIEVTDLLLEPPSFVPPDHFRRGFGLNASDEKTLRRTPRQIGADLLGSIVAQVEPDAWHPVSAAEIADGVVDPVDPRDPYSGRNLDPGRIDPETETPVPIYVQGRWATARLKGGVIVVRAPAFVLMGIEGLPKAVAPPEILLEPR